MKKLLFASAFLLTFLCATQALAFEPYVGINYGTHNYREPGYNLTLGSVGLKVGGYFNNYFAIEGRVGTGIMDDSDYILIYDVDLNLDDYYGAYIRGEYPVNRLKPYVMLGVTQANLTASISSLVSVSGHDTGISYGAGLDFLATKNIGIGLEYLVLIDSSTVSLDSINLGLTYFF